MNLTTLSVFLHAKGWIHPAPEYWVKEQRIISVRKGIFYYDVKDDDGMIITNFSCRASRLRLRPNYIRYDTKYTFMEINL